MIGHFITFAFVVWSATSIDAACRCDSPPFCSCDHGLLCPPPAFPDMFAIFRDTLSHSATIRNMTTTMVADLVANDCSYSPLATVDWREFNSRLCSSTSGQELLDAATKTCYSSRRIIHDENDFVLLSNNQRQDVDDEYDYLVAENEIPRLPAPVGMATTSPKPRIDHSNSSGIVVFNQGIAMVVGISCAILSLVFIFIILLLVKHKYFFHPKYDLPHQEAHCMRWNPGSRHGEEGGSSGRGLDSTLAEERMPTNAPNHPVKRYL